MEPTNPDPQAETSQGAPAAIPAPAAAPDEVRIPKARFDEVNGQKKEAEARVAALQAELERLKNGGQPAPATVELSTGKKINENEMMEVMAKVKEIERRDQRRELAHGLAVSEEGAAAVQSILDKSPDLKPAEALTIARARQPELFGSQDTRAFQPGQHGSLRPSGGEPPKADTLGDRAKKIAEIADPVRRDRETSRLLGQQMARALGWARRDQ